MLLLSIAGYKVGMDRGVSCIAPTNTGSAVYTVVQTRWLSANRHSHNVNTSVITVYTGSAIGTVRMI